MLKKLIIFIVIAIVGLSSVLGLQCHVCKSAFTSSCWNITENNEFLKECKQNVTECAIRITGAFVTRKCADHNWKCDVPRLNCETCHETGCNSANEIKNKGTGVKSKLPSPFLYLVEANSGFIGTSVFLLTLIIAWCSIRLCSRRKSMEYDNDEYEYEEDSVEYYENEV